MTRSSSSRVCFPFRTGRPAKLRGILSMLDRPFQHVSGCATKVTQETMHIEGKRKLMYLRQTLNQLSDAVHFKNTLHFSPMFKQVGAPRLFRRTANLVQVLIRNKS